MDAILCCMAITKDKGPSVEGLEEIDESECWRLLASQPVGRFAFILGHYPVVLPVNYVVVAKGIVFRTGSGVKLDALHRSNVSFEVDEINRVNETGWSVLVRGSAREMSLEHIDPELAKAIEAASPQPWAPGQRVHVVRLVPDSISGRRIHLPEPPSVLDSKGFL